MEKDGNRTFDVYGRETTQQDFVSWSEDVVPTFKQVTWKGLNKFHPAAMGYGGGFWKATTILELGKQDAAEGEQQEKYEAAEAQNWICHIDGHDLRNSAFFVRVRRRNALQESS